MNNTILNSVDKIEDININRSVILVVKSNDDEESSLVDYIKGRVSKITNKCFYIKIESEIKPMRILKKRVMEVKIN